MKPFEGVLGNNCELRLIQFLLPLEGIDFNITELAEEVEISRVTATKVVKKFTEWGLLLAKKSGNSTYYSINMQSPIVASIQQVNNALIETMLGDEELHEIHDYWESNKYRPTPKTVGLSNRLGLDTAEDLVYNKQEFIMPPSIEWCSCISKTPYDFGTARVI